MGFAAYGLVFAALAFPQLDGLWPYVTTDRTGSAHAELLVAPDRQVDECVILHSDFNAEFDERLCNQLRQGSVGQAGRDQHGQPIHATAIYAYNTSLGRAAAPQVLRREPLLDIGVNRLPDGLEGELLVGLRVVIDAAGGIEACEQNTRPEDAYTRAACAQVSEVAHLVRHDRAGVAVRYLTDVNVVFTAG